MAPSADSIQAFERVPSTGHEAVAVLAEPLRLVDEAGDDRDEITPADRVLLIVENDLAFARMLLEAAHDHGYKALITGFGAAALSLTHQFHPHAITLDISLPDINGWRVLERLKHDSSTRHIPIYIITTDEDRERGLKAGALGVAVKPIQTREGLDKILTTLRQCQDRAVRQLLLIEPDPERRARLRTFLPGHGVEVIETGTAGEALALALERLVDCLILNPSLPDMGRPEFVDRLIETGGLTDVPVLVHTTNGMNEVEQAAVRRLSQTAVVREVRHSERLLDLAALFLHRRPEDLSEAQRRMIAELHDGDATLAGRKVLIVDDDIRNILALTSILEQHQMVALPAETCRDAIVVLERTPDVDAVLMDVMMPEMDGLDTTRAIRQIPRLQELPIIAVTAKAMKGDRERCIVSETENAITWLPPRNTSFSNRVPGLAGTMSSDTRP